MVIAPGLIDQAALLLALGDFAGTQPAAIAACSLAVPSRSRRTGQMDTRIVSKSFLEPVVH